MPTSHRRRSVLVLAMLLLASACGGNDGTSAAGSDTTQAPTTTTEARTWGVDEVPPPAAITTDYVQSVLDVLDVAWGDTFRRYKADGGPTPENEAMLAEIHDEPALTMIRSSWGNWAAQQFEGTADAPGNPDTVVRELVRVAESCVLVIARRTLDEVSTGDPLSEELAHMYLALEVRPAEEERGVLNTTAWRIVADGRTTDGQPPQAICE